MLAGLITNTGMMRYGNPDAPPFPWDYPRNKVAVLIASPTDFRYQQMLQNRAYLERAEWRVKWIEFEGGHILAPGACYDAALEWLSKCSTAKL